MKKIVKKCLKWLCFIGIFVAVFLFLQEVLKGKWFAGVNNMATTSAFAEWESLEENSVDALFVGTSHVYYGVDPMYMYEETGITGFCFGGPGLRMDLTYLMTKHLLDTHTPKVVVLDMAAVQFMDQQTEARCHVIADFLPLNREKIDYAFNSGSEDLDELGLLFPFFRYHGRWRKVNGLDFKYLLGDIEETAVRGHYVIYDCVKTKFKYKKDAKNYELTERNKEYFEKIVTLCREKEIPLLLMKVPTPVWREPYSVASVQLAGEYGLTYVEFYDELDKIGLSAETDFSDRTDHLNQYGAEKFTLYIAEYLRENYNLQDHRGEYKDWDEDLEIYYRFKEEMKTMPKMLTDDEEFAE